MSKTPKRWTPGEKLRVIGAASQLDNDKLGELLRREGVHEAQVQQWRESAEAKEIKELERELQRKGHLVCVPRGRGPRPAL